MSLLRQRNFSLALTGSLAYVPPMPKMRKKSDLPTKVCAHCGRPFAWRKAWERVWEEVRYCSNRCRRNRGGRAEAGEGAGGQAPARP